MHDKISLIPLPLLAVVLFSCAGGNPGEVSSRPASDTDTNLPPSIPIHYAGAAPTNDDLPLSNPHSLTGTWIEPQTDSIANQPDQSAQAKVRANFYQQQQMRNEEPAASTNAAGTSP